MKWVQHVRLLGETRNAHKDVLRKPGFKRQVRRPRRRDDDIKMDVKDTVWGGGRGGQGFSDSKLKRVVGSSNTIIKSVDFRDVMTCSLVEPPAILRILFRPSSRLKTLGEDQDKVPSQRC